jgi:hypothetical protein
VASRGRFYSYVHSFLFFVSFSTSTLEIENENELKCPFVSVLFIELLTERTCDCVEMCVEPSRFVPGYSILPDSSTPSILIPSTLPTLSIGGFLRTLFHISQESLNHFGLSSQWIYSTDKDSLKRTVSNEQKETSYSATITYGTFPNNTCFQQVTFLLFHYNLSHIIKQSHN